jgi:hypothetical protein
MSPQPRWKLVPHLLLRRAGFPFALLEALSCPQSAQAARGWCDAQQTAQSSRTALLTTHFPEAVRQAANNADKKGLRALSRWRKKVGASRSGPVPAEVTFPPLLTEHAKWVHALEQASKAEAELSAALEQELWRAREALRQSTQDVRVREALFLLSPDFYNTTQKERAKPPSPDPKSDERSLERRLYAFLQRLSAKNETTSFFGPLTHGHVDPTVSSVAFSPETPSGVVRREAFASFWSVCALAKAATQDPDVRPHLPVRRIPASKVVEGQAVGPDGSKVPLPPEAVKVFGCVDDVKTVQGLAHAAGLPGPDAEKAVGSLERTGFVRRDLEPLSTTPHPLQDLDAQLGALPATEKWRTVLAELSRTLRAFEEASLSERPALLAKTETFFEQVTGKSARRGGGKMYADRTLLFEDCAGDLQPVRVAPAMADSIEAEVSVALALFAEYGRLRYNAIRTVAAEVLISLGERTPYLTFMKSLEESIASGALTPHLADAKAFLRALESKVRERSDGAVARLTAEDVDALCPNPTAPCGRFASPDVIAWRDQGRLRWVLGEVHPYVFAWGSQGQFAPDSQALQGAFSADLSPWGGREKIATVLRRRRHKGLVTDAFPGTFVEVTGKALNDNGRRVAISDLWVQSSAQGPLLHSPKGPLTLYVGEDDHPHLRCFAPPLVEAPPIRFEGRTPRLEVNGVVVQRARWEIPESGLPAIAHARTAEALFLAVTQARVSMGLPRYLFMASASEPKPMCVDLESPFAQSHLQSWLSKGKLALVEMLPDPSGLWLERSSGFYTSEWRIGMVRSP